MSSMALHTGIRRGIFYMYAVWLFFRCIFFVFEEKSVRKMLLLLCGVVSIVILTILVIPNEPELALISCSSLLMTYGIAMGGIREGIRQISPVLFATGVMQVIQ